MGSISWAEKVSGPGRDRPALNSNYVAGLTSSGFFRSKGLFYLMGVLYAGRSPSCGVVAVDSALPQQKANNQQHSRM